MSPCIAALLAAGLCIYVFSPRFGPSGNQYLIINYRMMFFWLAGCGVILMAAYFLAKHSQKK